MKKKGEFNSKFKKFLKKFWFMQSCKATIESGLKGRPEF